MKKVQITKLISSCFECPFFHVGAADEDSPSTSSCYGGNDTRIDDPHNIPSGCMLEEIEE